MKWKIQYLQELKSDITALCKRAEAEILIDYFLKKELNLIKNRLESFLKKIEESQKQTSDAKQEDLIG